MKFQYLFCVESMRAQLLKYLSACKIMTSPIEEDQLDISYLLFLSWLKRAI